ncbi:MAG TPA: sugar phosphate isomerase/epimerase [Anaerolineae bacterium]|nr:sugar phosphate isomerase/epimerase [Anaerolineae bacterium]
MNPIAFSTLACPEWPIARIITAAQEYGYDGVELRGSGAYTGHVSTDMAPADRAALRQRFADAGVLIVSVTAYTRLAQLDQAELAANLDILRRYVDLAADLGAPVIRTYGGRLQSGFSREQANQVLAGALRQAGEYAASCGVTIALETHDDFSAGAAVSAVLEQVESPAVGALWDILHPWRVSEPVEETLRLLASRTVHVHLRDAVRTDEGTQTVFLGEGEIPVRRIMEELIAGGYEGAFVMEWERAWHPELEPPEVVLPQYASPMRAYLQEFAQESP